PQPGALALVDGLQRVPESDRPPRLDLDDDEVRPVQRDDIELTLAAAPIAIQQPPSAPGQMRGGAVLPRAPENVLLCHAPRLRTRGAGRRPEASDSGQRPAGRPLCR